MSRYAREISDYQLSDYPQAVRTLLKTPFVTASFPDRKTIGRVRRFSETLTLDLREAFGYQLRIVKRGLERCPNAEPWRMSAADYQAGAKGIELRDNRAEAPWDESLSELMDTTGRAVMKESLLHHLLQDLRNDQAHS